MTITKIQLWKSAHFGNNEYRAILADGTYRNLESDEFLDVPWAYAIRMFNNAELAAAVEKYSAGKLPGLDDLHPVGYEFDFADLCHLVPEAVPLPKKAKIISRGPSDADIRSLEGNEDL